MSNKISTYLVKFKFHFVYFTFVSHLSSFINIELHGDKKFIWKFRMEMKSSKGIFLRYMIQKMRQKFDNALWWNTSKAFKVVFAISKVAIHLKDDRQKIFSIMCKILAIKKFLFCFKLETGALILGWLSMGLCVIIHIALIIAGIAINGK